MMTKSMTDRAIVFPPPRGGRIQVGVKPFPAYAFTPILAFPPQGGREPQPPTSEGIR